MYLIDRLKLVRCSLLVVIWLVTKLKLLLQKKSGNLGDEVAPLNRATCTDVVIKKYRTTLHFLQQIFATCKTGLNVGGKTSNIAFQLVLQQCCKPSCAFLLVVLPPSKASDVRLYDFVQLIKRVP